MSFLRSRAEQLADYLRGCIARGEVVEPLPSIRDWSARLGVGRGTLEQALKLLHNEGFLRILPRKGIQIAAARVDQPKADVAPLVRWIFHGRDFPDLSALREMFEVVLVKLSAHNIRLRVEKCDDARLRAIHASGENPNELLLLTSLPRKYQELFSDFRRSAMINGLPADGVDLPFVSIDVLPAIRHAVHRLARRGYNRVILVLKEGSRQPLREALELFCREAPRPIVGEVIFLPMELKAQSDAARRWSEKIKARTGVLAIYPVPASVLMTALMKRGLDVPGQVEVIAVNTTLQGIRVVPVPIYYPYPVEAIANILCRAATRYFERGTLPPLRRMVPLEAVLPD